MCCARYQVNIIELTFLLIILYWKMIMKRTLTDRNVNFPFVDENTSCLLKKWKWLVLKAKPSTWYIVTHKLRSVISHVITFQVALTLLTSTTKPKKRLKSLSASFVSYDEEYDCTRLHFFTARRTRMWRGEECVMSHVVVRWNFTFQLFISAERLKPDFRNRAAYQNYSLLLAITVESHITTCCGNSSW